MNPFFTPSLTPKALAKPFAFKTHSESGVFLQLLVNNLHRHCLGTGRSHLGDTLPFCPLWPVLKAVASGIMSGKLENSWTVLKARSDLCHSSAQNVQILALRGKAKIISMAYEAQNMWPPATYSHLFDFCFSLLYFMVATLRTELVPQICQACSYFRVFDLIVPSAGILPLPLIHVSAHLISAREPTLLGLRKTATRSATHDLWPLILA